MNSKFLSLKKLMAKRSTSVNRDPVISKISWEAHEKNPRTCEWCGYVAPTYLRREMLNIVHDDEGNFVKGECTFVERCFVCDAGVEIHNKGE